MSVHKLTGACLPGEANDDLVAALERLADRARRGEITSLAWAGWTGRVSDTLITGWEGEGGSQFAVCAAINILNISYSAGLMDQDE